MAAQNSDRVPGGNEADPENLRQRPFQGGTDGLTEPPTMSNPGPKRNHDLYAKFEASDVTAVAEGAAQGDAGASPALMSEPDVRNS